MKNKTIDYYDKNAHKFVKETAQVEFCEIQNIFLKYINEGAFILDFGCGSGRDAKYFLEKGYRVEAIDGSEEMCKLSTLRIGQKVEKMMFQDLIAIDKYDGIWACASLLHLNQIELKEVIKKIAIALRKNGVCYISFKYGDFDGVRNERYFIDMTEEKIEKLVKEEDVFNIIEQWITSDVRAEREDEKWLNIILRKKF